MLFRACRNRCASSGLVGSWRAIASLNAAQRLGYLSQFEVSHAQILVSISIVWLELNRLVVVGDRLSKLAHRFEGHAQIVVGNGEGWVNG